MQTRFYKYTLKELEIKETTETAFPPRKWQFSVGYNPLETGSHLTNEIDAKKCNTQHKSRACC